jgi:phytoene synthase
MVWTRVEIDDLARCYEYCRRLHKQHGRTYYLATQLLPQWKQCHVHALYGFMRHTDDIVDGAGDPAAKARAVRRWRAQITTALDGGGAQHPVARALVRTVDAFRLDRADLDAFLQSMEMDLTMRTYQTYEDLLSYMEGSAAAVGTLMLPILGAADFVAAREPARQLGFAFQLTNFIRDVAEDLDRGRIYLPMKDLAEHGVRPEDLQERRPAPAVRELVAYEVGRARQHYRAAAVGIPLLAPSSQACIRTAYHAYGAILDEVVRAGYNVFGARARVPTTRKVGIVARSVLTPPGRAVRVIPGRPR